MGTESVVRKQLLDSLKRDVLRKKHKVLQKHLERTPDRFEKPGNISERKSLLSQEKGNREGALEGCHSFCKGLRVIQSNLS